MNTLADNALYEAFLAGRSQVTRSEVERAAASLGWSESAASAHAAPAAPERSAAPVRPAAESSSPDLDAELEAAFAPAPPQRQARRPVPERAAAGRTTVAYQAERGPRPPPKLEDAVDELFTELIEEE
jgi:hypothetical protein